MAEACRGKAVAAEITFDKFQLTESEWIENVLGERNAASARSQEVTTALRTLI